jgi:rhodanese-related sulfurtransferase
VPGPVAEVSAPELKLRLDRGDPLTVLDVREDHERDIAAIPLPSGVVDLHVPLGEVARRFEEIEQAAEARPLVVYCHHGQRSMVAATWLARRGIGEVINLEGGIDAWSTRVDRGVRRY